MKKQYLLLLITAAILAGCNGFYASDFPSLLGEAPEDCLPGEIFDLEDQFCYTPVNCSLNEECLGLEGDAMVLYFHWSTGQLAQWEAVGQDYELADESILVTYQVHGDSLANPKTAISLSGLAVQQEDIDRHQQIWAYFTQLIPKNERQSISKFVVYSDGKDGSLAVVEQDFENPAKWVLAIDIDDTDQFEKLTYTLIHEFGHLLTLKPSQVPPDIELYYRPDDALLYTEIEAQCQTFFSEIGCSRPDSYINQFFTRFWMAIYGEWREVSSIQDDGAYWQAQSDFYQNKIDQFVNSKAAAGPVEDIAETWMHFILDERPAGTTIAEQKVLYFYQQPELVELRAEMISRIYSRLRRR